MVRHPSQPAIAVLALVIASCGLSCTPGATPQAAACDASSNGYGAGSPLNDPSCPPTWSAATAVCALQEQCSPVGVRCWYPNAGDGLPNGCQADALFNCFPGPRRGRRVHARRRGGQVAMRTIEEASRRLRFNSTPTNSARRNCGLTSRRAQAVFARAIHGLRAAVQYTNEP